MEKSTMLEVDHRHVPETLEELEGYRDQDVAVPVLPPCAIEDPELFDPHSRADLVRAKTVCSPCPIREVCLTQARASGREHGVWGGQYFSDGVEQGVGFIPRPSRD